MTTSAQPLERTTMTRNAMLVLKTLTVLLLLILAGCSAPDFSEAESDITELHHELDNEQFSDIYQSGSPELKAATSESDFVKFLAAVHRKLGKVQSSVSTFKGFNITTNGTFVTLNYKTRFAQGDAQEQFVYVTRDKKTLLMGYHINSMALIEN
jgi:hypothetical protein